MKNKSKIIFTLIIIINLSLLFTAYSQNPPCKKTTDGLTFKSNYLDHVPALSLDMPYDVMLSYLWIDSICRNTSFYSFEGFLKSSNLFDDSLKQILKYYYQFWDYDEVRAFSTSYFLGYNPSDANRTKPPVAIYSLDRLLSERLKELNGPPFDILSLIKAGLIVHIKVDSTIKRYLSEVERDELIVFCTIIDTIKGKVLPSFKNVDIVDPKDYDDPEPRLQRAIPGVKFQFTYWLDNLRMCPDFRPLIDSLGVPWTTSGNEYVVFLFPVLVCGDTTTLYYTLWPFIGDGSCVYNMFPVKDGLIYNPLHEYGVPDQSPVFLFKKRLRDLIDDILSKRTLIITEANNEDISINEGIRLSPNPATDFLEISYSDANHTLNGVVDGVAIYNVFGEKVLSTSPRPSPFLEREYPPRLTSSATPQEGNLRLDVSSLPAGVYFVRVGDKVGKFIKFE